MISELTKSLITAAAFISILPVPKKFIPEWNEQTLKYFCPMLAVSGIIFGLLWQCIYIILQAGMSGTLRGFVMMISTLALTGGLHTDGLMDTCDAVFSRRDRETRLKILSDTHAGSFAVMGCVIIFMAKTLLFSELPASSSVFLIPVYSRLGMAVMLNDLPFAKSHGLAVMLGSSRDSRNNIFFALMAVALLVSGGRIIACAFWICLALWAWLCVRMFGGITGDLLGAFVELSEVVMLGVMVCI